MNGGPMTSCDRTAGAKECYEKGMDCLYLSILEKLQSNICSLEGQQNQWFQRSKKGQCLKMSWGYAVVLFR